MVAIVGTSQNWKKKPLIPTWWWYTKCQSLYLLADREGVRASSSNARLASILEVLLFSNWCTCVASKLLLELLSSVTGTPCSRSFLVEALSMLINPCWKTHAKWKTPLSMLFLTKLPKISAATSHSWKEKKHTKLLLAAAALHHLISLNNKYLLQLEQAC